MNRPRIERGVAALVVGAQWVLACTPPASAPPAAAPTAPAAAPVAPEAELSAPVPPPTSSAPTPAPTPVDSTSCIAQPDPELERESPWGHDIGRQLALELPNARRCTADLPEGEEARLTLRLVYGKGGEPLGQYVLSSDELACSVAECVKQELADVNAVKLDIERGSIDLALVLRRDAAPERSAEPVDPLGDDQPSSCVSPEVRELSRPRVREIVATKHAALTACYGQALVRRHDAEGTVTFEFTIGQGGELASVQARESTLHDCPAIECMLKELAPLTFPAPVGRGLRVIYPVKFVLERQQPVKLL